MKQIKKVVKQLEEAGMFVRNINVIEGEYNSTFYGDVVILHDDNFSLEYNKRIEQFILQTTFSNQTITNDWIQKLNTIYNLIP